MKKDTKSGLSIKQLIAIFPILIILATLTTQHDLYNMTKSNIHKDEITVAKEETEEINQEEVDTNEERKIATTSRTQKIRTMKENDETEKEEIKQEIIKYKSLNEIKISKKMDLTKRCDISKEDFKKLIGNVKQDKSKFFYKNSDTIYDLCQKYELNEIFFCGLIAGESGWNISTQHRKKNNYISMMSNGRMISYSSCEEGLEAAAKLLHNKYLTKGGAYYSGKTLKDVKKMFCPDVYDWTDLIYSCMEQIKNSI